MYETTLTHSDVNSHEFSEKSTLISGLTFVIYSEHYLLRIIMRMLFNHLYTKTKLYRYFFHPTYCDNECCIVTTQHTHTITLSPPTHSILLFIIPSIVFNRLTFRFPSNARTRIHAHRICAESLHKFHSPIRNYLIIGFYRSIVFFCQLIFFA